MDNTSVETVAHSSSALALIYAAEKLFAEHGIASVSLRQINQAANHRNIAAAHYHFGSRDGLVKAVLHHRWHRLDRRRREMLQRKSQRERRLFAPQPLTSPWGMRRQATRASACADRRAAVPAWPEGALPPAAPSA